MEKSLSIFSFKKWPCAFLVSVAVFFITQAVLINIPAFWRFCYFYSHTSTGDALRMESQLRMIDQHDSKKKIFIIGSSQAREDFDVDILNKVFSGTDTVFYNLGLSGYGSPLEMFMIKDKILAYKPDAVIYMPFVGSFYPDRDFDFRNITKFYFTPKVVPYMVQTVGWKKMWPANVGLAWVDSWLGSISILFQYREPLQQTFMNALYDRAGWVKRSAPAKFAYTESVPKGHFLTEIIKQQGNKYRGDQYTQLNELLFSTMTQDFRSHGIPLIVVSGPMHPLASKTYHKEIKAAYDNFLREQSLQQGFAYLAQDHLPDFGAQEFIDFTHLNEMGRQKMSLFLANYLIQKSSARRMESK